MYGINNGIRKAAFRTRGISTRCGENRFFISIIGTFILVPTLLFRFMALIERGFV